jgi:hypothetical protein
MEPVAAEDKKSGDDHNHNKNENADAGPAKRFTHRVPEFQSRRSERLA